MMSVLFFWMQLHLYRLLFASPPSPVTSVPQMRSIRWPFGCENHDQIFNYWSDSKGSDSPDDMFGGLKWTDLIPCLMKAHYGCWISNREAIDLHCVWKERFGRLHFWASLNTPRGEAYKSGLTDAAPRDLNKPLINGEYIKKRSWLTGWRWMALRKIQVRPDSSPCCVLVDSVPTVVDNLSVYWPWASFNVSTLVNCVPTLGCDTRWHCCDTDTHARTRTHT